MEDFTINISESGAGADKPVERAIRQKLVEQAITDRRSKGEPHPVYLVLSAHTQSLEGADYIGPVEQKFLWIVTRRQAVEQLKKMKIPAAVLKTLREGMQKPKWDKSYWSIVEMKDSIDFGESRLFQDMPEGERA